MKKVRIRVEVAQKIHNPMSTSTYMDAPTEYAEFERVYEQTGEYDVETFLQNLVKLVNRIEDDV